MLATMQTRPAAAHDVPSIIGYVTDQQRDPTRRIAYVGDDDGSLLAEFEEVPGWPGRAMVAVGPDGRIEGVLVPEVDDDMGRVWLIGPWAVDDATADALYRATPDLPIEQELAPVEPNRFVASFALRHGFVREECSVALRRDGGLTGSPGTHMRESARPHVAALHDSTFPGTHRTGADLVSGHHRVLTVGGGAEYGPDGYVASEIQPDGSGYIDFLGVRPEARGQGLGRMLVEAAVDDLLGQGVDHVHLTVRAGNDVARRLYASVGFVEDMVLVPFRRGFSLD